MTKQAAASAAEPARETAPRRITREAQKAETKLLQLERAKRESLEHHEATWDAKRVLYIEALPEDVRAILVAGGVINELDLEEASAE